MLTFELLNALLVRLQEKDRILSTEIKRISSQIKAHREKGISYVHSPSPSLPERRKFHTWRRISFQLHNRRSKLKNQRDSIQTHIHAIFKKLDEIEGNNLDILSISKMDLTGEPVSAGARGCQV
jgi:hypothetical protein